MTQWINAPAGFHPVLDAIATALSTAGVPVLVLLVIAQWWSTTDRMAVRHVCVNAGLSFLLGLALNQFILLFIHRPRPYDAGVTHLILTKSADWSFPSDHATASLAIAAAFLLGGPRSRAIGLTAIALAICWSRVYVGTHYLTDVLGGGATALAAAFLVHLLYRQGTRADRFITGIL